SDDVLWRAAAVGAKDLREVVLLVAVRIAAGTWLRCQALVDAVPGSACFVAFQRVDGRCLAFRLRLTLCTVDCLGHSVVDIRFILACTPAVTIEVQRAVPASRPESGTHFYATIGIDDRGTSWS